MEEIYRSSEDPEQSQYENGPSFALYDADRDGVEELIVRNTGGSMSDMWTRVYGYDEASKAVPVKPRQIGAGERRAPFSRRRSRRRKARKAAVSR